MSKHEELRNDVDKAKSFKFCAIGLSIKFLEEIIQEFYELKNNELKAHDKKIEYSKEFTEAWAIYPRKQDVNKKKAYKAWLARIKAGVTAQALIDGTQRYATHHRLRGTEQQFIMLPATFYGPDEHFLTQWSTPDKSEMQRRVMADGWHKTDAGIMAKAKELGVVPMPGQSFADLKSAIINKLNSENG